MKLSALLPIVVAALIVGGGTYVNGIFTDRFGKTNSELLDQFTVQVPKLPLRIGPWEGRDQEIPGKEFALTNCTAYVSRPYINRQTGDVVSVYVVSGTARHITIHTPDWCYQGAGYKMETRKPEQTVIDCENNANLPKDPEFLTSSFRKSNPTDPTKDQVLRIFWTYSDNGDWLGPGWAKRTFAGKPAMYKIYVISDVTGGDSSIEANPAQAFVKDALSKFNKVLFAQPTTTVESVDGVSSDLM